MISVVDLGAFSAAADGGRLVEACEEWGCFRVVNHGVPVELLAGMKEAVRAIFELPMEVKRRNVDVIAGSGYVEPSELNPLYEALGLYDAGVPAAVERFCSQLEVTDEQRDVITSYSRHLHDLALRLAAKMAESLGLSSENLFEEWASQFRINSYAFTEETVGSGGVCTHTDCSFLTILQEDDLVGGLEVMDTAGGFTAVDPVPGSFVINLGDIAKVWSNGRFRNLKHRVQCKEAAARVSIALFLLGPREKAVEPPPALVVSEQRRYRSFSYEEYRLLRLSSGSRSGDALGLYEMQQTHAAM